MGEDPGPAASAGVSGLPLCLVAGDPGQSCRGSAGLHSPVEWRQPLKCLPQRLLTALVTRTLETPREMLRRLPGA